MKRRVVAIVLSLSMLMTSVPAGASSVDLLPESQTEAETALISDADLDEETSAEETQAEGFLSENAKEESDVSEVGSVVEEAVTEVPAEEESILSDPADVSEPEESTIDESTQPAEIHPGKDDSHKSEENVKALEDESLTIWMDDVDLWPGDSLNYPLHFYYYDYDEDDYIYLKASEYEILEFYNTGNEVLSGRPLETGNYYVDVKYTGPKAAWYGETKTSGFSLIVHSEGTADWAIESKEEAGDTFPSAELKDLLYVSSETGAPVPEKYYEITGCYKLDVKYGVACAGEPVSPNTKEEGIYYITGKAKGPFVGEFYGIVDRWYYFDRDYPKNEINTAKAITAGENVNGQCDWLNLETSFYCFTAPEDGVYSFDFLPERILLAEIIDSADVVDGMRQKEDNFLYHAFNNTDAHDLLALTKDQKIYIVIAPCQWMRPPVKTISYAFSIALNPNHVHSINPVEAYEPECESSGEKAHWKCDDCGMRFEDADGTRIIPLKDVRIPPLGHSFAGKNSGKLAGNATCSAPTAYFVKCDRCGVVSSSKTVNVGSPLGHSYGAYGTTKNPTVFSAGTKTRTCSRCGSKENAAIAKLPASISMNATSVVLKKKQSTTGLQINLAAGDRIASIVSSNTKVVKADVTGANTCKITALNKAGKANLTIRTTAGAVKVIPVKVQGAAVQPGKVISNLPANIRLARGQKIQMKGTAATFTCTQKPAYTTSKKAIATVGKKNGVITAKKAGKTKITCKIGNKKATCTVVVY